MAAVVFAVYGCSKKPNREKGAEIPIETAVASIGCPEGKLGPMTPEEDVILVWIDRYLDAKARLVQLAAFRGWSEPDFFATETLLRFKFHSLMVADIKKNRHMAQILRGMCGLMDNPVRSEARNFLREEFLYVTGFIIEKGNRGNLEYLLSQEPILGRSDRLLALEMDARAVREILDLSKGRGGPGSSIITAIPPDFEYYVSSQLKLANDSIRKGFDKTTVLMAGIPRRILTGISGADFVSIKDTLATPGNPTKGGKVTAVPVERIPPPSIPPASPPVDSP